MIESFGAESPVIVVLNKIQEKPFDVNRRRSSPSTPASASSSDRLQGPHRTRRPPRRHPT